MRQTLRQIVAVLALIGIVMNFVPNTFAATSAQIDAANELASAGFINDHADNTAAYNLDANLSRAEAVKTAGIAFDLFTNEDLNDSDFVSDNCTGMVFKDLKSGSGWSCAAAELAAEEGLATKNEFFNPTKKLTRFEALLFALRSAGLAEAPTASNPGANDDAMDWAEENGFIDSVASFNKSALVKRGEYFVWFADAQAAADEGPTVPGGTGGAVQASLGSSSPAGYTVPKGANGLHVASYRLTANATTVVSGVKLKRVGLSDDTDTANFAVLVNGVRSTDARDENSDDEVTLTFKNGGVTLSAGQSVTLDVLMDVASGALSGAEIAVSLVEVVSNGTVSGLPVTGNTFRVGTSSASQLEIKTDGSVSNPTLGREGADLFRFKAENKASNDTMWLRGITFKQIGGADENTDIKNYKLMKGSEVLATVASTNTQYVSFVLSTPLEITSGNSVSLKVVGDVVGGAGETIEFEINSELDIMASSNRYGNAIDVLLTGSSFAAVTVKAGVITLVKVNPTVTKIREDKDEVVLGTFKVVSAQEGLEVKKLGIAVTTASGSADSPLTGCAAGADDSACYLSDVQVRVVETGARYDLTANTVMSGAMREYYDSAFDYSLAKGTTTFEVVADTENNITAFDTANFTLSMAADLVVNDASANGGLRIEETSDDEVVTDITPSSLSWNKVDGSESGLTAGAINTGTQNVVIGGDSPAFKFSLDSDESSAATVDELTVTATLTDANSNTLKSKTSANQIFTQARLYKDSVSDANLIKSESASDFALASGVVTVTFDDFETTIPANTVQNYIVVFTVVDDSALGDTGDVDWFAVSLTAVSASDDDNDDITVSSLPATSASSKVIVKGVGTLVAVNDVDNAKADFPRNVLGNTTSPYIAAYKLTATNEAVKVKDVTLTFTDASTDFTDSVNTVSIYNSNDVLLSSKTVSGSDTITFNGLNFTATEGNSYLYVKVSANKIGKNAPGVQTAAAGMTVALSITDAEGTASGDTLGSLPIAASGTSNAFQVVPVRISALAFVNSYSGTNLATTLSGSDDVIGILAVTADSSTNTKAADGSELKLELDDVRIKINTNANLQDLNDVKLIKIGGSDSNGVSSATTACATTDATTTLPNSPTCVFDTNAMTGEDELIPSGTTSYYKITADTATASSGTATVRPELAVLDGGTSGSTASIEYSSDDSATLIYQTRLDFTTLNGSSVSITN